MLEYTLQTYSYGDHYQVSLTGNITLDESKAILTRLWNEPKYAQARSAIWDLSGCNTLPDFDEFLALTRFIANEKAGRGPRTVVFTSPAFAAPLFARALQGFEFLVGLSIKFMTNDSDAAAWLIRSDAPED